MCLKKLLTVVVILTCHWHANAQQLLIAVAANLHSVTKALQADFTNRTGIKVDVITGSSGKLTAQISNGAPYDIFLSADMAFPQQLFKSGFTNTGPVVYASGKLIIASNKNLKLANWKTLLQSSQIKHIAIANPAVAPYGKAAEDLLKNAGVLNSIKKKLVYGESIAQVNTYIITGTTEVGFTTQALIKEMHPGQLLYWHSVPAESYTPIKQGIILLKKAEKNLSAKKFYQYILSTPAKRIFKKYGYIV